MKIFDNLEQYVETMHNQIGTSDTNLSNVKKYESELFLEFRAVLENITEETFWELFPRLLGIDCKLSLLGELFEITQESEISGEELIEWVEQDYLVYIKELCGYSLNMDTNKSLVFNVE